MSSQHTVLITAAGGNIGSELVPQLLAENHKLVLPTSNASRLESKLPSHATLSNVTIEEGNIKDPIFLQSILTKHVVDVVFLCLTGTDELITTLNFFDCMQRAGCVKHLIYLSACGDFRSTEGVKNLMRICSAEHVVVKSTIEQKMLHADFPWTSTRIGPTLFMSNDVRSRQSMLERGVFDEPLGENGVSRVATSDIALAIRKVIANPTKYDGKKIAIGSLKRYTATEVAALWSEATGRDISAYPNDEVSLDEFERHFIQKTGCKADWGRDLRLMYAMFRSAEFGPTEEEYKEEVELLGKEPEDYVAWVRKTGESWRKSIS